MASQVFQTDAFLRGAGSPGQFYVKYTTNAPVTVTDTADDGTPDNVAILGDIKSDHYQSVNQYGTVVKSTYVGRTADGKGIVGSAVDKQGNSFYYLLTNSSNHYYVNQNIDLSHLSAQPFALCFCSGTFIRTTRGEIAVERLTVGDLALTVSGIARPIVWIGCRDLGAAAPIAQSQWPVRVMAGAFGRSTPSRDLYLSPGHPVLVGTDEDGRGGSLVPVMCLINGTTIDRVARDSVVYWHVELDQHDIVLADGLPVESFLDLGCRDFFDAGSDELLQDPDAVFADMPGRCRPVALDGPLVERVRCQLDTVFADELAGHCAWSDVDAAVLGAVAN